MKRSLTQLTNDFTITAWGYDLWRTRSLSLIGGEPFPLERELALMLSWTRPTPGAPWLDVGTSTGIYAQAVAGRGARVLGLDASSAMVRVAQARRPGQHLTYRQGFLENAPLEPGSFEGIVVGATLNEFTDTALALERMAALLRPGGRLFLMYVTPASSGAGTLLQGLLRAVGVRIPARSQVREVLSRCGLLYGRGEQRGPVALELYYREGEV